jgi:CHAD domain-containing protein
LADDRIIEWASLLVQAEIRDYMEARRRFLRSANAKRLHDLRKAARRLSCSLEDFRGVVPTHKHKRLKSLIDITGHARDAAVLRERLKRALDQVERDAASPMLKDLKARERDYLKRTRDALKDVRFKV